MARPRSFDEAQVLHAARERFSSTGYAATSIDEVAAATGLGKGSLYGAFGDKHQLFLRVFEGYCAEASEQVEQALAGPDAEAFERLRAHVHAVVANTAADIEHRGCLLARGTSELAGQDPAVAAHALRTFELLEDLVVACLEKAQRHGDIDPEADPRALAGLLLAVLRGIEALGKAGKSEASLRSIAETALAALPRPAPSTVAVDSCQVDAAVAHAAAEETPRNRDESGPGAVGQPVKGSRPKRPTTTKPARAR